MSDAIQSAQLVVFTLGAEQYALPIQHVHEIISYVEPRSVASSVPGARGVISLRGKIVPIFDLGGRLDATVELGERTKIVIIDAAPAAAGGVVGEFPGGGGGGAGA